MQKSTATTHTIAQFHTHSVLSGLTTQMRIFHRQADWCMSYHTGNKNSSMNHNAHVRIFYLFPILFIYDGRWSNQNWLFSWSWNYSFMHVFIYLFIYTFSDLFYLSDSWCTLKCIWWIVVAISIKCPFQQIANITNILAYIGNISYFLKYKYQNFKR